MRTPQLVKHIIYGAFVFAPVLLSAQENGQEVQFTVGDTNVIYIITPLVCKGVIIEKLIKEDTTRQPLGYYLPVPITIYNTKGKRLPVSVHGNILYDFNYRSYIDTPFSLKDVRQHYVQSNFSLIYANQYPVDIVMRWRQGNNIYLRNYFDVNVFFNGESFKELAKRRALNYIENNFGKAELEISKENFFQKANESFELNEWLHNEQTISRYLEYKTVLDKLPVTNTDSISTQLPPELNFNSVNGRLTGIRNKAELIQDGADGELDIKAMKNFVARYESRLDRYNKLKKQAEEARLAYEKTKAEVTKTTNQAKNAIHAASSNEELRKLSAKYGISTDSMKNRFRVIEKLKSFGIGRSFVDYSELTVKNVSINGVHAEYSSKNYYAFAAGTVDYRFRDFMFSNINRAPQYVALIRYGKVLPSQNQFIVTAYKGRKYANFLSDSNGSFTNVFGMSAETKIHFGRSTYFTGELAKSSVPAKWFNTTADKPGFDIKDKSTAALFASFYSFIRGSKTKIRANYRYQGANFQSFTLYFNQTNSVAWSVLADQSLFKNKLNIQAGIRKNEFTNPFATYQFSSSIVFKSLMASLRLKKLPFLTVAYMPSSQLSIVDGKISESRFYTFTTTASHYFKIGTLYATSLAMYSRFYNSSRDTGFVYYNSKNIHLNQSFTNGRFVSSSTYTMMINENDHLYTYDQGVNFTRSVFSFGGGVKYSDLNHKYKKLGVYGSSNIELKKLGADVNILFEHGYLPGSNHDLIANDMGRVLIIKRF